MRQEKAIRAVWTDFGGVITPPMSHTWKSFCDQLEVDPDNLLTSIRTVSSRYGCDDFMQPLDTPLVSERDWLAQVGDVLLEQHGQRVELETLGPIWFDDRETDQRWIEALRAIRRAGLFVGVLSNMVPAWDPYWRKLVPVDELFDDVVLSFEVGTRKPEPEMFRLASERAGVAAAECLLVDDLTANCAGAVAAGWSAIEFADTGVAVKQLDALLATGRSS